MTDFEYEVDVIIESYISEFEPVYELGNTLLGRDLLARTGGRAYARHLHHSTSRFGNPKEAKRNADVVRRAHNALERQHNRWPMNEDPRFNKEYKHEDRRISKFMGFK